MRYCLIIQNTQLEVNSKIIVVVEQEERRLRERALDLRRQSVSAFKLMSDARKDDSEDDDEEET